MTDYSLCWLSGLALARRIRAGELSVAEVTETFLEAIAEFNGPLNAVVTVCGQAALEQAASVQQRIDSAELNDSKLAGVPFLAKDLDVTAGIKTTFGSMIHRDYVPRWDMFHISRLKDAGCVLIGKTNTPEDGVIPNTINNVFGATRNPWSLEHCAGGSSGGSGAAVAAGLAPLATGSDGGGSIRIPSSFNGVFGFKPTFGSIPFGPKGIGIVNTIAHLGPLTRSVADAAAMLDIMAGPDEKDRASLAKAEAALDRLEEPWAPRVAVSADLGYADTSDEVRQIFQHSIDRIQKIGWSLVDHNPGFADPASAIRTLVAFEWGTIPMLLEAEDNTAFRLQSDPVRDVVKLRKKVTLDDLWNANQVRKQLSVKMGAFFEQFDLLLTPTLTRPAYQYDRVWPESTDPAREDRSFHNMLYPFNLTGDPACSIPIGLTSSGLPVGLQIVGPRHADAKVLQAARICERSQDEISSHPPHGVR